MREEQNLRERQSLGEENALRVEEDTKMHCIQTFKNYMCKLESKYNHTQRCDQDIQSVCSSFQVDGDIQTPPASQSNGADWNELRGSQYDNVLSGNHCLRDRQAGGLQSTAAQGNAYSGGSQYDYFHCGNCSPPDGQGGSDTLTVHQDNHQTHVNRNGNIQRNNCSQHGISFASACDKGDEAACCQDA